MVNLEKLGRNIRGCRKAHGWTQSELAEALGVVQSRISSFEAGRSIPSLEQLLQLMDLFGISSEDLLVNVMPE